MNNLINANELEKQKQMKVWSDWKRTGELLIEVKHANVQINKYKQKRSKGAH